MPTYSYRCQECGELFDVVKPLKEYASPEMHCGNVATKIILPVRIAPDYEGYVSPATGEWIEGKRAHIEDLKKSGCRILEPGEVDHYEKNWKKDREAAIEKELEPIFAETVRELKG